MKKKWEKRIKTLNVTIENLCERYDLLAKKGGKQRNTGVIENIKNIIKLQKVGLSRDQNL